MLLRFDPTSTPRPISRPLPIDVVRHGDEVRVTVDLPGVDPADIDVTVDRQVLTITAKRTAPGAGEDERVIAAERTQGTRTRRLTLGDSVDAGAICADVDRGVLTLHLPVTEAAKPRRIEVAVAA